ncbi:hypothetical protein GIB67_031349 [Kingdonia uniflora]|uniref:Nop domain-containing protein n=1 Tax=Kingdonia uniflora TaxID=39325 RepID=A0A7J7MH80_9MAGN|nr:hypothetical protein GIB67_031349 [Kingdonia uniflora]
MDSNNGAIQLDSDDEEGDSQNVTKEGNDSKVLTVKEENEEKAAKVRVGDEHGMKELLLSVDFCLVAIGLPFYWQSLMACNALTIDMDNEIHRVQSFLCDNYSVKFPELESLVHHPIDYARVVKKIGNKTDMTRVDLQRLLSSAMIMVVSVIASTTNGRPLPEESLEKIINAWSAVAAKLLGSAGGLSKFVKMPDDTVRHLGMKSTNLAGFSRASSQRDVGYLGETEIY